MSSGGGGGSGVHAIGKFSDLYSPPPDDKGKREYDKAKDLWRQQKCMRECTLQIPCTGICPTPPLDLAKRKRATGVQWILMAARGR